MTRLNSRRDLFAIFLFCALAAITSEAQTFTSLASFDGLSGADPASSLVQGPNGDLYGTTFSGGPYGKHDFGTLFSITTDGEMSVVYDFCPQPQNNCPDGEAPYGNLILASDGNFYGTTSGAGFNNYGTVFKISSEGTLTTLYSFCPLGFSHCIDGANPVVGLVKGTDGNFYGTTQQGGVNNNNCYQDELAGCGTIFRITPSGKLTTLYSFCAQTNCADGFYPDGGLVQGTDGNFYGTTYSGGIHDTNGVGGGTVFKVTRTGKLTTLHNFCQLADCADGVNPAAGVVEGSDGNFYGTTELGGAASYMGTIFKMTAAGTLTTLYRFCQNRDSGDNPYPVLPYQCPDGGEPTAGLTLATDGNFYGTTYAGGYVKNAQQNCNFVCGTVFQITPQGQLTTLHRFDGADGNELLGGLLQGTDGRLYGTTYFGGTVCVYCGTVFRISMGLNPFVKLVRASGKVGQTGGILGQGLTGTTGVFLNGTPASFTVVSDTFIRAMVPPGATTGFVTVETLSGTLSSNVPFHVIP